MQTWIIFKDRETGQELAAYTLQGTFAGEAQATRELLASELGIDPAGIQVTIEERSS